MIEVIKKIMEKIVAFFRSIKWSIISAILNLLKSFLVLLVVVLVKIYKCMVFLYNYRKELIISIIASLLVALFTWHFNL